MVCVLWWDVMEVAVYMYCGDMVCVVVFKLWWQVMGVAVYSGRLYCGSADGTATVRLLRVRVICNSDGACTEG